jgi:hypothetical protein
MAALTFAAVPRGSDDAADDHRGAAQPRIPAPCGYAVHPPADTGQHDLNIHHDCPIHREQGGIGGVSLPAVEHLFVATAFRAGRDSGIMRCHV